MRRRYDFLYALGAFITSPVWAFGLWKTGKWRTDWRGRFGKTPPLPHTDRPTILLHGVSVGEINATRALVALLTASGGPPLRVVISATTNTGFDRARELYGGTHEVVRFPFDFSWMVSRFFDAIRPDVVALVELEVWPNLAQICRARGIPLAVINGRLSDASYKNYRWAKPFVRSMFRTLSLVGAQTEEYARRFQALGTPRDRIFVTDTMKWDTVKWEEEVFGAAELRAALGIDPDRPLVVAGSTGPGEEKLLLEEKPEGVQLLLVPRKPERFDEVFRLLPGMVRRSERPDGTGGAAGGTSSPEDVYLLDTMGELTKAYSLCDVAVVGRSFVPLGGSDPIEAIALGKPTIIGPHYDNFRDVVTAFHEVGGIRVTKKPMREAKAILDNPEVGREMGALGRKTIQDRQGATERNAELLKELIVRRKGGEFSPGSGRSRVSRWLFRAFLGYLALGYLTTAFDRVPLQEIDPPTTPLPALDGTLLSGAFSVHTDRSHDATGTREQVARAAASAGLDFVVIGDHPPDDRKPGWEIWQPVFLEGVLIEGGQELRSPEAGKVLAVGVDTTYRRWEGDYPSFASMLVEEEATAFVVHGRGPRGSERWVSPTVRGMQGWEVLDASEFARHRLRGGWSLYHALTLVAGTPFGLGDEALNHLLREGFETPTVAAFDSFRVSQPLTATAGLNVHPKVGFGSVLLPSYGPAFRTLITHVAARGPVSPDPKEASAALFAGVRGGEAFISVGGAREARGFRMGVVAREGSGLGSTPTPEDVGPEREPPDPDLETQAPMGSTLPFASNLRLRAGFQQAPGKKLLYRVLRNGEERVWISGPELEWNPQGPGIYRVEVYTYSARLGSVFFRLRPWIFGNPVELAPEVVESAGAWNP